MRISLFLYAFFYKKKFSSWFKIMLRPKSRKRSIYGKLRSLQRPLLNFARVADVKIRSKSKHSAKNSVKITPVPELIIYFKFIQLMIPRYKWKFSEQGYRIRVVLKMTHIHRSPIGWTKWPSTGQLNPTSHQSFQSSKTLESGFFKII